MSTAVFCLADTVQAEAIASTLADQGFSGESISVLGADGSTHHGSEDHDGDARRSRVVGGALGWMLGIGALALPGVGAFVAAGPVVGLLAGAAVGASAGGLVDALTIAGVPDDLSGRYATGIAGGAVLVSVEAEAEQIDTAKRIFADSGGRDIASEAALALSPAP